MANLTRRREAGGRPAPPDAVRSRPVVARRSAGSTAAGVVLAALGAFLCALSAPLWWFGSGILVALATGLWVSTRPRHAELRAWWLAPRHLGPLEIVPLKTMLELGSLALLVCISIQMLGELAGGDRPISHDHPVHYFKAWQLERHLVHEGRVLGWTHRWFAGYPVNYLYPFLGDLWINAVRWLGFGSLSLSQAYGIGIWLFYLFTGYALYRYGSEAAGRAVGLLAALAFMTDTSAFREGGWTYAVHFGVWPQSLSLAFGLLGLSRLPALVSGRRLAPVAGFGLCLGLALLAHPVQLLLLPLVVLLAGVAAAFSPHARVGAALLRVLVGTLLALVVSSAWLLPFLSSRRFASSMGLWWKSTHELGYDLMQLDVFEGTLGFVVAFGVLGIVLMLRSRDVLLLFTALIALCVPVLFGSTFVDEFHLPALSSSLLKVQFVRMSTMVKPFWFVAAAYLVVAVTRGLPRLRPRSASSEADPGARGTPEGTQESGVAKLPVSRRTSSRAQPAPRYMAAAFVLAVLLSPIALAFGQAYWSTHVERHLELASKRPYARERRALVRWARQALPSDVFYRVALVPAHKHDHSLMDLATQIDKPIFKTGFTPCSNFVFKLGGYDRETLESVNVRYAIAQRRLPASDFELLREFGPLRFYRFKGWRPEPFRILQGGGRVDVLRFDDEEIVLRAHRGAFGMLRLNVSYFPRWRAYHDAKRIRIMASSLDNKARPSAFITTELLPGSYRFVFERHWVDHLAAALSGLALLLVLALWLADRRPGSFAWLSRPLAWLTEKAERLCEPAWARARLAAGLCLAAALLLVGVALALWQPAIDLAPSGKRERVRRVRYDFVERLAHAEAQVRHRKRKRRCQAHKDQFLCPNRRGTFLPGQYVASEPATIEEYTMVRCVRATPDSGGTLEISFRDVPRGEALVGYYGVPHASEIGPRESFDFSVRVDGRRIHRGAARPNTGRRWLIEKLQSNKARKRADVTLAIHAKHVRRHRFCFNLQMVDLH